MRPSRRSIPALTTLLLLGACGPGEPGADGDAPAARDMGTTPADLGAPAPAPEDFPTGRWEGALTLDGQTHPASATLARTEQKGVAGVAIVALDTNTQDRRLLSFDVLPAAVGVALGNPRCTELSGGRCEAVLERFTALDLRASLDAGDVRFEQQDAALTLRPIDAWTEPNDGVRPSSPDGPPWPPTLADRPRETMLTGIWSGSVLEIEPSTELLDPLFGGVCDLYIYARDDATLQATTLECAKSPDFDSEAYYRTLTSSAPTEFTHTPEQDAMSFRVTRNGQTLRYRGEVTSRVIEFQGAERRLYEMDGLVEREVEGVWVIHGAFVLSSWGE